MKSLKDFLLAVTLCIIGAFSFGLLAGYWCGVNTATQKPTFVVVPVESTTIKDQSPARKDNLLKASAEEKINHSQTDSSVPKQPL